MSKRVHITKEELIDLYVNKRYSLQKVSDILGCSGPTIGKRLRYYNIYVRSNGESLKGRKLSKETREKLKTAGKYEKINISKEQLKMYYVDLKLSTFKVGKLFNCSDITIAKKLRKYNISVRSISEAKIGYIQSSDTIKKRADALRKTNYKKKIDSGEINLLKVGVRKCKICGNIKKLRDFYYRYKNKTYRYVCSFCFSKMVLCNKMINKEKYDNYHKEWCANNRDKTRGYSRRHRARNSGCNRKYIKKRMSTIKGKINCAMSGGLLKALKGNKAGRHWENLVGYTLQELRNHLKLLFKPGMTWDNYGMFGWHIDHIIPKSYFSYNDTDDIEFKKCWSLSNLQPLWAMENWCKGNKIM